MRFILLFGLLVFSLSCREERKSLTAQEIIDKTIEEAGGDSYENTTISFTFRDKEYSSKRGNGQFELTCQFTDSIGEVRDVLNNDGFIRLINEVKIALADSMAAKYSNSVNSVHYFVQLPFGLNDPAVKKELVGEADVDGKNYYEIKITFAQEGGGEDHEDEYMYWIAKDDLTVDYFAYKFYTDEGGIRFRKAYNPRKVSGIRFVDYKNFKLESWENVDLKTVDSLYEDGKLELLSEIKTENISVEINKKP